VTLFFSILVTSPTQKKNNMTNSEDSKAQKLVKLAMVLVSMVTIVYHASYLFRPGVNAILHQNIHLAMAFVLLSLHFISTKRTLGFSLVGLIVLALSLAVTIYIHLEYERLAMWAGFPEFWDVIVGVILVLLVTWFTYLHWGGIFPILAGISVAYAFFGHYLGGVIGHPLLEPKLVLSSMGIGFEGVYGMMLNLSANVIFFFVIFGALFESVGISDFFRELGKMIGNRFRGGTAVGSAASSSLLGMVTGGSVINVALAGSFTIPAMKNARFRPEVAGGIESTASTGGGLTPPVMGIAIFIMASLLNTTYTDLLPAVVLPAVVFYFGMFLSIFLVIRRDNIPKLHLEYASQDIKAGLPVFLIPISILVYLLIKRYPPAYAAFYTVLALIVMSMLNKRTRPTALKLLEGLTKGCVIMASLALVLAMIGIFVSMVNMTSAGPKLTSMIMAFSGGNMLLALFLTMFLCMILGCALPAPIAYMVVALVVAPGLKDLGVSIVATHLFCFYFSFLSAVTPPIAGAAMVASRIAGASFMKTGWEALKFSLPFFVVPYFVIFNPAVIFESQPVLSAAIGITLMFLSASSMAFFAMGYLFGKLSPLERLLFLAFGIMAIFQTSGHGFVWGIVAGFGFTGLCLFRFIKKNPGQEDLVPST
jgi:TRAP transporter 4TM/12TM fusion protein